MHRNELISTKLAPGMRQLLRVALSAAAGIRAELWWFYVVFKAPVCS